MSQALPALTPCPVSKSMPHILGFCQSSRSFPGTKIHFCYYCCVENCLKNLRGLNQQFYFARDFVHQKFEKSLAEQFSLEVIHEVAIRCQLGLQTSDDLTGLDFQDGSLIRLRVDAGCQLQAQLGCRSIKTIRAHQKIW